MVRDTIEVDARAGFEAYQRVTSCWAPKMLESSEAHQDEMVESVVYAALHKTTLRQLLPGSGEIEDMIRQLNSTDTVEGLGELLIQKLEAYLEDEL